MVEMKGITAQVNECPCRGEVFAPIFSHLHRSCAWEAQRVRHQQEHGPSACITIRTGYRRRREVVDAEAPNANPRAGCVRPQVPSVVRKLLSYRQVSLDHDGALAQDRLAKSINNAADIIENCN